MNETGKAPLSRRWWLVAVVVATVVLYAGLLAQRPHSAVGHLTRYATGEPGRPRFAEDIMHGDHSTVWIFMTDLRDETQILKLMKEAGWTPTQRPDREKSAGDDYDFVCNACYDHRAAVTVPLSEYSETMVWEQNGDIALVHKLWLFLRTGRWFRATDPSLF